MLRKLTSIWKLDLYGFKIVTLKSLFEFEPKVKLKFLSYFYQIFNALIFSIQKILEEGVLVDLKKNLQFLI